PITRAICKGPPGQMYAHPWCTTDHKKPRPRLKPHHGPRAVPRRRCRKTRRTQPAGGNFADKTGQFRHDWHIESQGQPEKGGAFTISQPLIAMVDSAITRTYCADRGSRAVQARSETVYIVAIVNLH